MKYRATIAAWFSSFFEKALVSLVNLRIDILIVNGQLISELSLPKTIFDRFVHTWEPRIPLNPFALPQPVDLSGSEPPHTPDVDVKKKLG